MKRLWHIAFKDVLVWVRDPAAMGVLLGMPVVLIFILGSALGGMGGEGGVKVAVVDLSRAQTTAAGTSAPPSDELVTALVDSERIAGLFAIELLPTEKAARQRIREGEVSAALVIPRGFDDDVASGRPVDLIVLKDPGSEMAAGIWETVVTSFAARYSAASVSVQTVVETVSRGNPAAMAMQGGALIGRAVEVVTREDAFDGVAVVDGQVDVADVEAIDYYGLSMVSMFLMFGAMFGAFSTIKENREQTMNRMLSTPTPRWVIVAGKMFSVFLLGMTQFAVLYVFTRFIFGVQWGDDVLATVVVAAAEMLAVTGLATLIASFARTERAAGGIGPLVVQIQALIGGAFFTIAVLPEWVQPIRYFSVIGWTMEAWSAIQIRGAGLGDVVVPVLALTGMALALFAVGVWRTEALR